VRRGFIGIIVGLVGLGCQSTSSETTYGAEVGADTLSILPTADVSPCEAIRKKLSRVSLPYRAQVSYEFREPFPPYLQSWLLEKLAWRDSEPIFSPVGQISYGRVVVWLIEVMDGPRPSIYALLVDENCQVRDKLEVAAQIITSQSNTTIQTTFDADGNLTLFQEYNEVRPNPETGQLHAETHREQKRYRLDTERRRFVAL
jgi:hypothetical protein